MHSGSCRTFPICPRTAARAAYEQNLICLLVLRLRTSQPCSFYATARRSPASTLNLLDRDIGYRSSRNASSQVNIRYVQCSTIVFPVLNIRTIVIKFLINFFLYKIYFIVQFNWKGYWTFVRLKSSSYILLISLLYNSSDEFNCSFDSWYEEVWSHYTYPDGFKLASILTVHIHFSCSESLRCCWPPGAIFRLFSCKFWATHRRSSSLGSEVTHVNVFEGGLLYISMHSCSCLWTLQFLWYIKLFKDI